MTNMFKHKDCSEYTGWPKPMMETFEDYQNHVAELSSEQIAWEFLRRNKEYIGLWQRARKEAESILQQYRKGSRKCIPFYSKHKILGGQLRLSVYEAEENKPAKFTIYGKAMAKFGIFALEDPSRDDLLYLEYSGPDLNQPIPGRDIPELIRQDNGDIYTSHGIVYIPFNIFLPIAPQIKRTTEALKALQKGDSVKPRSLRRSATRTSKKRIALYLFLLDKKDARRALLHLAWRAFKPKNSNIDAWRRDQMEQAEKMRNDGYRKFLSTPSPSAIDPLCERTVYVLADGTATTTPPPGYCR